MRPYLSVINPRKGLERQELEGNLLKMSRLLIDRFLRKGVSLKLPVSLAMLYRICCLKMAGSIGKLSWN